MVGRYTKAVAKSVGLSVVDFCVRAVGLLTSGEGYLTALQSPARTGSVILELRPIGVQDPVSRRKSREPASKGSSMSESILLARGLRESDRNGARGVSIVPWLVQERVCTFRLAGKQGEGFCQMSFREPSGGAASGT